MIHRAVFLRGEAGKYYTSETDTGADPEFTV
jgi:hypothetical protein